MRSLWGHRALVLGLAAALAPGCTDTRDAGACGGQPCSVPQSRAALLEALGDNDDAVAAYFRQAAAADGTVGRDWSEVLGGIGDTLECDEARSRSFIVLSNLGLAPKGLVTHCSDEPVEASRFFAVFEPDVERGDLDGERFRMVGWDATAGTYRRYQMVPREDALSVSVEPEFCTACHGGRFTDRPWVPIMNEMTNPWAQWNAEPSFRSLAFDEHFEALPTGEVFDAIADPLRLESASRLEPVVRAAFDRVTAARISRRTDAPDIEAALELLRPVFCDETINYVSEIHRSGELASAAVLDPGLRRMVRALGPAEAHSWSWLHDDAIHLALPGSEDPALLLIPVRGEATVQAEAALVSRQVLTPMQVLRVRALDWSRPVDSTFRCELHEAGRERVLRDQRSAVSAAANNAALLPLVYEELLRISTPAGLVDLSTGDENTLVAIADAGGPDVREALAAGDLASYTMTLAELGDAVQTHLVQTVQAPDARARLHADGFRRACAVAAVDLTAPFFEDAQDCP
jgi:hypothetical protein